MIVLIDTSTPTCHLSLVLGGETYSYELEAGRALSRQLLGFLRDKLQFHQLSMEDIKGVGTMRGPGSFTGLRIGLAVMNTLADTLEIPIVGETGERWDKVALERLRTGEDEGLVLPLYGGSANITAPRK